MFLFLAAPLALAGAGATLSSVPAEPHGEIGVGVLAVLDDVDTQRQWQPLFGSLAAALPAHRLVLHALDPAQMEQALQQRALAFVITNPGHSVVLEARHGATRIATQSTTDRGDPAHAVGSTVVVRAGRPTPAALGGLEGWRVAAVAEDAFGGYQLVAAEWARQGLNAEAGDVRRVFTGYPMSRVLDALLQGQADAAIVRTCLLERWEREGRVPAGALQVVAPVDDPRLPCRSSTPLYPGWAFVALPQVPPALAHALALALLTLPPDEQGTRWSVPADYQPVHEVLRTLEVEPYAYLRATRLQALARRYWFVLGGVLAALALAALYALRVEALVKRRTAELTRTLRERDRLASELEQDQQRMDHLSRLSILGELSATLGHELNQPLATIANYASSVQRRATAGQLSAAALQQALHDIGSEAERAAHILQGIRALARRRPMQRRACDPAALAGEAVALFRGLQAHAPEVGLVVEPDCRGVTVHADALQIQQVLLNLLKNAVDAHRGGGTPDAPLLCRLRLDEGSVCIEVHDQGPPLTPEQRVRLFEPFFTTKPDGLGLGLPICRTIVEAHGGALRARPADPRERRGGMIFEVRLPLHDAAAADRHGAAVPPPAAAQLQTAP